MISFEGGFTISKKLISATDKELAKNYRKALDTLRREISKIYEKYGSSGALTYAEMSKYNRLTSLFKSIAEELGNVTGYNARLIKKLTEEAYGAGFYHSAFEIESGTAAKINFGLLNHHAVRAAIENPISGLSLSEVLANHSTAIKQKIRQEITQGLVFGESYPQMAKRIKGAVNFGYNRALTIARTEGGRARSMGQLSLYDEAEDEGIQLSRFWVATTDFRTRDSHQYMDGKKADKKGLFKFQSGRTTKGPHLSGIAKEDINCRCRVRVQIGDIAPTVRRYPDGVFPYQTYEEWRSSLD